MVRSQRKGQSFPGSGADSTEYLSDTLNQSQWDKRLPSGVVRKFGDSVPVQVSSSSTDRGSKRRGPSKNCSRVVASKWDANIKNNQ
ncbi:hypothetical protein AVEN_268377-1 [Araneus ventricosus]|uniref:Uncharacterized protein n=1 Tax=Araneus ventricosus TaxID=182803 RepID=A0A4Y2LM21_ARAVE|nr:hypothetical protein AVEN_268377-1 [Araneus ventricosus]